MESPHARVIAPESGGLHEIVTQSGPDHLAPAFVRRFARAMVAHDVKTFFRPRHRDVEQATIFVHALVPPARPRLRDGGAILGLASTPRKERSIAVRRQGEQLRVETIAWNLTGVGHENDPGL